MLPAIASFDGVAPLFPLSRCSSGNAYRARSAISSDALAAHIDVESSFETHDSLDYLIATSEIVIIDKPMIRKIVPIQI